MKTTLPLRALAAALVLAWGCGGKVAIDGTGGGSVGTGGSDTGSTSSTSSSTSTSAGPLACDFACGGPIGLCGCSGQCSDGKQRGIGCGGAAGTGFVCDCVVEGQVIGTCAATGLACQFEGSCCAALFGE